MNSFLSKYSHALVIAGFVFSMAGPVEAKPTLPEDVFPELQAIIAEAAKRAPRMLAKDLELLVAEGDLEQSRAGLLPALGGFYQVAKSRDKREDISGTLNTDKTYYSLTFTQPLFHWGTLRNNANIGAIRRLIADENYNEAYRILAQEIRSAYLGLILDKVNVRNATYSRKLAEDLLATDEDRLQKGVISEGSIFQTRMAAEQARLGQEMAEWSLASNKVDFALLSGQSVLPDENIPNGIPGVRVSADDVNRLLDVFLAQSEPATGAARIIRKQLEIDELDYKNQKVRLRPKLSFVVGITQDEQSYTANIAQKFGVQSSYAGLQVTWNIFDGFATRGAIASTLARKRLDEQNYRAFVSQLNQNVRKAAKAVEFSQRQLAISERLLDSAGNYLTYIKEDFKRGQTSEAAVNGAQANYNNLDGAANTARKDYLMRVAEFMSLISDGSAPGN